MSELQVEDSIDIKAPAGVVWDIISHPDRYAEWVSNTDAVNRVHPPEGDDDRGPEEIEVEDGLTYEERNKVLGRWRQTSQWRVIEVVPEQRIVHEAGDLPMAKGMRVTFALAPAEEGEGVTYTHTWDVDSKLGVAAKALTPMVRRDIQATLENLKSLAEREAKEREEALREKRKGEESEED
jgi:uncharacterized protein YndB with AHSA1/START domain